MTKNLIILFKNLTKNSVNLAGDKGSSLGEMTNVGIPVKQEKHYITRSRPITTFR